MPAGDAPRQADLKARQWFAAGDTVRLVASGPGFAISSDATALSHGMEGQPARVRTEGGRVLSGRPVGERRVEVEL
jgi:flagella basal body P-ring formation protein FlgA